MLAIFYYYYFYNQIQINTLELGNHPIFRGQGKTRQEWENIIPPHRHGCVMNVSRLKKKETMKSGRRRSNQRVHLCWVLLFLVTHNDFNTMWYQKKDRKKSKCVCVHVCVCVRLVIPIRGCVFFLHYLSSLSSQQFYFRTII